MKFVNSRAMISLALLCGTAFLSINPGNAEPVINQFLSGAVLLPQNANGCPVIKVNFNIKVGYASHFPINGGRDLRIKVDLLDANKAEREKNFGREAVLPPKFSGSKISTIDFEINGSGPMLTFHFNEKVNFSVHQGDDFSSILVAVAGSDASSKCKASLEAAMPQTVETETAGKVETKQNEAGKSNRLAEASNKETGSENKLQDIGMLSDAAKIEVLMAQAKTAIAIKEYGHAVQLLTKLISIPEHKYSAKAQELLGVVRERKGQMSHAKAEYEIYLKKYPNGEGAKRVYQRLAAISTAESAPPKKLRKAGTAVADRRKKINTDNQNETDLKKSTGGSVISLSENDRGARQSDERLNSRKTAEEIEDPSEYKKEFIGSFSQFFYFNQGSTRFEEFQSRRKTEDDDVYQNSLLTSINLIGSAENDAYRFKWRLSGSHERDFLDAESNKFRLSAAYLESEFKEPGIEVRLGRQTRRTGGVSGRFDGGLLSWQANELTTLNFVAGSPVNITRDMPFTNNRWFYGVSVDFEDIVDGWDLTLYGLEQRAGSFIDRRAVGGELRFTDDHRFFYSSLDYDLYFNTINSALIRGTYIFDDHSTLSGSADYVRSPGLRMINSLVGQSADSLEELRKMYSISMIRELALDRTSETMSANMSYSRPFNDMWQILLDGTVFNTSGNPASGGVDAIEAPGTEYFASTQLIGTGVFKPNDMVSLGLRYANTFSTDLYLFDAYTRFNFYEKLRLKPRIKVGYRTLKRTGGEEIFYIPSITGNYKLTDKTSIEIEIGGRWSNRTTDLTEEHSNEAYIFGGYRYDF